MLLSMQRNTRSFIIGSILLAFIILGAWQFYPDTAIAPSDTQTLPADASTDVSTSTEAANPAPTAEAQTSLPAAHPLPLAAGDRIASWDFKGAYSGNAELTQKAYDEIARLTELLKTATSSAMILAVGVSNQYEMLGKGKEQYQYLGYAVRADTENGLPWHNLGTLMERLGAFETARIAYEKAVLLQPYMKLYHYAYLEFLTSRMKDNAVVIEKAFQTAEQNIGSTSYLSDLYAQWKAS